MATATQPEKQKETGILEEKTGAVVTLRLNRPDKQNRLTSPMCRALLHALLAAGDDKKVRAIVLTGAGNDFCLGGDLEMLREARHRKSVKEIQELLTLGKEICVAMATMPKMIIAAVNGPAANAGMGLALASDLRVASDNATFLQGFTQLGLYPGFGSTYFLPRLIGLSRASELFYTGETLDAKEACRIGIVYQVFPASDFDKETRELAEHLAAGPPLAYRDLKRTMIGEKKLEMEDAFDEEIRLQTHCFTTEDCAEGLDAFFENRKPKFKGY
jgi:2-(1,2-epoxy-1,2-dihydrophenyl)acetyl-CoA isomerase